MAGCVTFARTQLLRHPSFWGESEAEQLPHQLFEDPRVIASEQYVYDALTSQTTPFVATLDEVTLNVGFAQGPGRDAFRRVLAAPGGQISGFTWADRHHAYLVTDKMHLGHESVVCEADEEAEASVRRAWRRLHAARLEAARPPAAGAAAAGDSLFEAFSTALWGTPAYAPLLRQLTVAHMAGGGGGDPAAAAAASAEYAAFLGDNFPAYLAAMARPGTAGDELVLRALCDRFGVAATTVTGDEVIWCVRYPPRRTLSQREVFLAAAPGGHFATVRRQSAMTALKLTLGGRAGEGKGRKKARV